MSIDILSKDILSKAEDEKKLIEKAAEEEMSKLQEEFNTKIGDFKKSLFDKHEKEVSYQREKILGEYKKDSKRVVLDVKTKLLDEIYSDVLETLKSMKGDEKREFYQKVINSVTDFDYKCVKTSKKDSKILRELLPKEVKVSIDDTVCGTVFISSDEKQIVDMTIESILKYAYEDVEEEIQEVLFR